MTTHHTTTPHRPAPVRTAFTVVELMVVVGIIALLAGLLFPALGSVMRTGRATRSQSNLRQWGVGTLMWSGSHDERLPWEGLKDAASMTTNLATPQYWANAVPPLVGQAPFSRISEQAFTEQRNIPAWNDTDSIFTDPAAEPENAEPWGWGQPGSEGVRRQFYFNYVPNSQLNNTVLKDAGLGDYSPDTAVRLAHLQYADRTVLMLEMRANRNELPAGDPHYGRGLDRHRADWKRFGARHSGGGHLLYGDGHVGWVENTVVTTNSAGSRDPATPNGDWNANGIIWDPVGPATDE